jgi:hypothetical protein
MVAMKVREARTAKTGSLSNSASLSPDLVGGLVFPQPDIDNPARHNSFCLAHSVTKIWRPRPGAFVWPAESALRGNILREPASLKVSPGPRRWRSLARVAWSSHT